jgi:putative flippase GtrA
MPKRPRAVSAPSAVTNRIEHLYTVLKDLLAGLVGAQRASKIVNLWQRFWRYAAGSLLTALFSQFVLFVVFSLLHLESARDSAITATLAGAVPSYFLNRNWAWGKRGRSSWAREVIPYFAMAITGLVFSTWAVDFANSHANVLGTSRIDRDFIVQGSYLLSFALLWFGKFALMHSWLFAENNPVADQIGEL